MESQSEVILRQKSSYKMDLNIKRQYMFKDTGIEICI